MKKYYDLFLFLLILISIFILINNFNLTGIAIEDNGTIIDNNGTIVSLLIFYPNDYYNSSKQNLTFNLNSKNIDIMYSRVNDGKWEISLVNDPHPSKLITLNEGLNTVYFYGCRNQYCSLTRNVKVYYNKTEQINEGSISSSAEVNSNLDQNLTQSNTTQILTVNNVEKSSNKKTNFTKIIVFGTLILLGIFLIIIEIYKNKKTPELNIDDIKI